MANITITTSGNVIDVNFGDYSDGDNLPNTVRYYASDILKVEGFADHVAVSMKGETIWYLVSSALGTNLIVDSVNSNPSTDLTTLTTLIKGLMI